MKNDDKIAITSYSDRCLDDGTMLIAHDLEILVLVVEQGIRLADLDGRVRVGFAAQLLEELVDVIVVDVAVAASENAATSPPITETACNPDGSHGTPKPSRSQRNAASAASSAFSNWLFSHARYSVTRLSIRMLSISANVLVLSHRFQRFAVRVVQAEPVAVVRVDGDVDAPIVPVDGAFDVGRGEAPLGQVPVAVDGL